MIHLHGLIQTDDAGPFVQKKKNKSYIDGTLEVKEGNTCTLFNEVILSLCLSLPAICCAASLSWAALKVRI